ncbi:MAG TPA: DUF4139 domain-containing protein [Gemmatimonadaceae bacterium]|nr:DUF4139 domain-containing protein [Gemmatimonadaceae bacterium]
MVTRRIVPFIVAFAAMRAASGQATQSGRTAGANANVPVTKVMLFSSGVGYFEHAGTVRGNESTELRFRTSQINDILKSLVLQDQNGGHVGAITYPSQDPLAKTLKSFQVDITQNPTLAQLLNQLRGARVTIEAQAQRLSGTILGVEFHQVPTDKGEPISTAVLNLLTGATIRSINLASMSDLTLEDPQLQDELTKALTALTQARDQDKKPVTINFTGAGERHVRIGYVVETPVWKTSYRLLLDDGKRGGRLQGWAIVENQTESDWNNVSLSLVSGRPISFMMDLYRPLYATRPTVVPELFASLRPQVYEGGMDQKVDRVVMDTVRVAGGVARRIGYGPDGRPIANQLSAVVVTGTASAAEAERDFSGSVESMASSGKLGELFQYTVGDVTLPRQKSAMLPIITDSIEVERLSIYNASVLRTNPLNGVRLKNTTGKHLLQGPVTVLDKGGYAGDARIDDVPPGQERFLSYGIDLDMRVDNTKNTRAGAVRTASIVKGVLYVTNKFVSTQEYAVENKTSKDKIIVIEHPVRPGYKLVDTQAPIETTPTVYRFKGTAVANKITTLTVKEESVSPTTIVILSADVGQLLQYSRTNEIPKDVRDALAKAAQMRQSLVDVERDINARSQHIAEITAEQTRIRENMKTVSQTSQYYQRLLSKLNEQESSIEGLQKERDDLTGKRDDLRRQLEEYLNGLTLG